MIERVGLCIIKLLVTTATIAVGALVGLLFVVLLGQIGLRLSEWLIPVVLIVGMGAAYVLLSLTALGKYLLDLTSFG